MLILLLLLASPEPGQYPGDNHGFVPPPQEKERPKVYDQPSSAPEEDPNTYVSPGGAAGPSSQRKVRDDIELGYRRMLRKDPFGALSAFKDALAKNPNDVGAKIAIAEAHYAIALFYQRRGRMDEARKEYKEALAIDPSFAEDDDFRWHYELAHNQRPPSERLDREPHVEPKKVIPVDDGRPSFMQRPWIGPHVRVGPHALAGVGGGAAFLPFWRIELTFDPIFIALSAHFMFYVPTWAFSPYLSAGGRLAFLNPPIGTQQPKQGLELWATSFGNVGAGIQYTHPIGFYATLGIEMLFIGNQKVGGVNANITPQSPGTVVYPFPLPNLSIGWLFGG